MIRYALPTVGQPWSGPGKVVIGLSLLSWLILGLMGRGAEETPSPLEPLLRMAPRTIEQLTEERLSELSAAATNLEGWSAELTWQIPNRSPRRILEDLEQLVLAKQGVDERRIELWALRGALLDITDESRLRDAVRLYLQAASQWIDLSGRLRYSLHDAIDVASYLLDPHPAEFREMIDLLIRHRVQIAASTLAFVLLDPLEESGAVPFSDEVREEVIELCRVSQDPAVLPFLAEFLHQPNVPAELTLAAMEAIRHLGLPQSPHPDRVTEELLPAITAEDLLDGLERLDAMELDDSLESRRIALERWLGEFEERGNGERSYRWGGDELRAGDWLLMRNPSPYNRFTDLGTGLFTHVGVVAEEVDSTGVRRWVIVEVPERRAQIPATNVDAYLQRTLHYAFLRHSDPEVAASMANTAQSVIGNECQFDLTFRTERVEALRGKPLNDVPIHTYCAGLLLICADATQQPRSEFFPIEERSAGAQFLRNLERLGMAIGEGFVSPTAPLFSDRFEIVSEREPMYDPGREVKEAVYDHFADGMLSRELRPSPDAYQQLRERLVGLAQTQPWLRRAVAQAANVSEQLDLESAARAAAVVETLDEIADAAAMDFERSRAVILLGESENVHRQSLPVEELKDVMELRQEHGVLLQEWLAGGLTPRQLRTRLVEYYSRRGQQQLDERFFPFPK